MPISLLELAAELESSTFTLRGNEIPIRALSAAEWRQIKSIFAPDRPRPPLVRDPQRGGKAPQIADPDDPVYREAFDGWLEDLQILGIVAGAQIEGPDGVEWTLARQWDDERLKAWAMRVVEWVRDRLTRDEIRNLDRAIWKLDPRAGADLEEREADAKKL